MSLYRKGGAGGSKESLNSLLAAVNGAAAPHTHTPYTHTTHTSHTHLHPLAHMLNGNGNGNGRHHLSYRQDSDDDRHSDDGDCRVQGDISVNGVNREAERPLLSPSSSSTSLSLLLAPTRPTQYGTRVLLLFLLLVVASLAFVALQDLHTQSANEPLTTTSVIPPPTRFQPVVSTRPSAPTPPVTIPSPPASHTDSHPASPPPSPLPPSPPASPPSPPTPSTPLPTYALPPPAVPPRSPLAIPAPLTTAYFWCQPIVDGVQQMSFFYLHIPILPWHDPIITRAHVVMYEAEVDLPAGAVRLLLWDRPQNLDLSNDGDLITVNNPVWYAHIQSLAYLAAQIDKDELRCHILQAGQLYRDVSDPLSSKLTWSRPSVTQVEHDQWNWLQCDFDPALGPPIGIQLLHMEPAGNWVVLERAICPYELPRTFATGLIKGLYNQAAEHLHFHWDYIGYNLKLGIDFFYVIDQTPDQRLRKPFQPLIDRGLVQYLYWPDADGIKVQFAQTAIHHVWSTKHSTYAWAADMDEYLALPNTPFTQRPCLFEGCPSPLQALLTSERYSRYVGLEMFAIIMPLWTVPEERRAVHPEDNYRWQHNESWHRHMAYSGRRGDPSYLAHQARAIYHSTLPPFENDRKTIYLVNNVTLARTHDVYPVRGRKDLLSSQTDTQFFADIHIMHYRHIFGLRNLQLDHDNEEHFWQHAQRETLIADIVEHVKYPAPCQDFTDTYPRE